jgi:hypothetical protein
LIVETTARTSGVKTVDEGRHGKTMNSEVSTVFFFEKVAFAEALEVNLRVRTRRRSRTRQTQRVSSGVWKLGHHRALSAAL